MQRPRPFGSIAGSFYRSTRRESMQRNSASDEREAERSVKGRWWRTAGDGRILFRLWDGERTSAQFTIMPSTGFRLLEQEKKSN